MYNWSTISLRLLSVEMERTLILVQDSIAVGRKVYLPPSYASCFQWWSPHFISTLAKYSNLQWGKIAGALRPKPPPVLATAFPRMQSKLRSNLSGEAVLPHAQWTTGLVTSLHLYKQTSVEKKLQSLNKGIFTRKRNTRRGMQGSVISTSCFCSSLKKSFFVPLGWILMGCDVNLHAWES